MSSVAFANPIRLAEVVEVPRDACSCEGLEVAVDRSFGAVELVGDARGVPVALTLDQLQETENPGEAIALADSSLCIRSFLGHRRSCPEEPGTMCSDNPGRC